MVSRLQFYAMKDGHYKNKLFTFQVNEKKDCFRLLLKFAINGNVFHSAYFNTYLVRPKEKNNLTSDNLKSFIDYFNRCEYDDVPTLEQAVYDYKMYYNI